MRRAGTFRRSALAWGVVGLALGAAVFVACGPEGFDPQSKVTSVRVLSARVDKPYAKPGDRVTLDLLVYPGPPGTPQASVYWFPLVCVNPVKDLYYACFAQFAGVAGSGSPIVVLPGDAGSFPASALPPGSASAATGSLEAGADITDFLQKGNSFSFGLPGDIVATHPPTPGSIAPYGLAFAFNIACTGRVRLVGRDAGDPTPQVSPLECVDDAGVPLPPESYVIGFSRVYVYDAIAATNPTIDGVTWDGTPVDFDAGVTMPRCTTADKKDCPKIRVQVNVPASSQESGPDSDGGTRNEQVWATFYGTNGIFNGDIRVLYDPDNGAIPNSYNEFQAPQTAGAERIWVVVRDDRNGAAWVEFPLTVQ